MPPVHRNRNYRVRAEEPLSKGVIEWKRIELNRICPFNEKYVDRILLLYLAAYSAACSRDAEPHCIANKSVRYCNDCWQKFLFRLNRYQSASCCRNLICCIPRKCITGFHNYMTFVISSLWHKVLTCHPRPWLKSDIMSGDVFDPESAWIRLNISRFHLWGLSHIC